LMLLSKASRAGYTMAALFDAALGVIAGLPSARPFAATGFVSTVQKYFSTSLKKTPGGSLPGAFRGVPAAARLIFQLPDAMRLTHCRLRARALRDDVVQLTAALQVAAIPGTAPTLSHSGDSAVAEQMNIDGMWRDRVAAALRASTSRVDFAGKLLGVSPDIARHIMEGRVGLGKAPVVDARGHSQVSWTYSSDDLMFFLQGHPKIHMTSAGVGPAIGAMLKLFPGMEQIAASFQNQHPTTGELRGVGDAAGRALLRLSTLYEFWVAAQLVGNWREDGPKGRRFERKVCGRGLTLVHFSAQLKRILWNRGAFSGCLGGV